MAGRFDRGLKAEDIPDHLLEKALQAYATGATPTRAAMAAETNRSEILRRERIDEEFKEAVARAKEAGKDYLEEELLRKGGPNAMMKILQVRRPEYRDSVKVEHTVTPPSSSQLEEARRLGMDDRFRLAAHNVVDQYLGDGEAGDPQVPAEAQHIIEGEVQDS